MGSRKLSPISISKQWIFGRTFSDGANKAEETVKPPISPQPTRSSPISGFCLLFLILGVEKMVRGKDKRSKEEEM